MCARRTMRSFDAPHLLATFGSVVVEAAPLRSTWIVGALSYLSLVPRGRVICTTCFSRVPFSRTA